MSAFRERLKKAFLDKEYRHAYIDEFLNSYIATQIKVLREERGWTQAELAERANMKQARISTLENVAYSRWSISTLKRLAEAFDLALSVSFETFGTRLEEIERFDRGFLRRESFTEEALFREKEERIDEGMTTPGLQREPASKIIRFDISARRLRENAYIEGTKVKQDYQPGRSVAVRTDNPLDKFLDPRTGVAL